MHCFPDRKPYLFYRSKKNNFYSTKIRPTMTPIVFAITTLLYAFTPTTAFPAINITGNVVDSAGNPPASLKIPLVYIGETSFGKIEISVENLLAPTTAISISHGVGSFGSTLDIGPRGTLLARSIYVGNKEYGLLNSQGGQIGLSGDLFVGGDSGAKGLSTATLTNSNVSITGKLLIGSELNGQGKLTINNKSTVSASNDIIFGNSNGSIGTGEVSGASYFAATNNGSLIIGNSGTGNLSASTNSLIISSQTVIGNSNGITGTMTLDNASFENSESFFIGNNGIGNFIIQNGAIATTKTAVIGASSTGEGNVTLSGANSKWNVNSKALTVGDAGKGSLTLNNGNTFNLNTITLSEKLGSSGKIYLNNGTLEVKQIIQGLGTGTIESDAGTIRSQTNQSNFTDLRTAINLNAGGLTIDNAGFAIGIKSNFNGSGPLTFTGGGTTTLHEASTYTGSTTIQQGMVTASSSDALGVGGSILVGGGPNKAMLYLDSASVQLRNGVTVQNNGSLTGFGSVGTTTLKSGSLIEPGLISNDQQIQEDISQGIYPGTLNITGDLTMESGSSYSVHTNPSGSGVADQIIVSGTANLAGKVLHAGSADSFNLGERYLILSAANITGGFEVLDSEFAFLDVYLDQTSDKVYLKIDRNNNNDFSDFAKTPNQKSVADALETINKDSTLYKAVERLKKDQVGSAYDSLTGEIHAQVAGAIRDLSGFIGNASLSSLQKNLTKSPSKCISLGTQNSKKCPELFPAWVQTQGFLKNTKTDGNAAHFKQNFQGIYLGFDEEMGISDWRLGGSIGYSLSHLKVDNNNSKSKINNYSAAIYAGKNIQNINVLTGLAYTQHQINTYRNLDILKTYRTYQTDYRANSLQWFSEVSYQSDKDSLSVEPFLGLRVTQVHLGSLNEGESSSAALSSRSENKQHTSSTLGFRKKSFIQLGQYDVLVHSTLAWKHAWRSLANTRNLQFSSGYTPFTIAGVEQARNSMQLDIEAEVAVRKNLALSISYQGEFAQRTQAHTAMARLRWAF